MPNNGKTTGNRGKSTADGNDPEPGPNSRIVQLEKMQTAGQQVKSTGDMWPAAKNNGPAGGPPADGQKVKSTGDQWPTALNYNRSGRWTKGLSGKTVGFSKSEDSPMVSQFVAQQRKKGTKGY